MRDDEVTPRVLYLRRREFLALGAGSVVTAAALSFARPARAADEPSLPLLPNVKKGPFATDEAQTPYTDVTHYNNYYEFGTGKGDPAASAGAFPTRPWKVTFDGEIGKPQTVDIDELMKWAPLEERIYRMRCVEVVDGHPLGRDAARRNHPPAGADAEGEVRRLHGPVRPAEDAGPEARRPRLALRGGPAPRRGDAPAHSAGRRPVRARASQPERRPRSARGAVEVRL